MDIASRRAFEGETDTVKLELEKENGPGRAPRRNTPRPRDMRRRAGNEKKEQKMEAEGGR